MSNTRTARINVRLSPEQLKALMVFAKRQSASRSSVVRCLIDQHITSNNEINGV